MDRRLYVVGHMRARACVREREGRESARTDIFPQNAV